MIEFPVIVDRQCSACKLRYKRLKVLMLNQEDRFCGEECYLFYNSEINELVDQ